MKRVVVGDGFESLFAQVKEAPKAESAEVIEARTKAHDSKTRSYLAYGAVAGGAVVFAASAAIGIYDGSFDELQSMWNVCGPIVGGVFGHYFGGSGKAHGNTTGNE